MTHIILPARAVCALLLFVDRHVPRPYKTIPDKYQYGGLHIEANENGTAAFASNGHMMGIMWFVDKKVRGVIDSCVIPYSAFEHVRVRGGNVQISIGPRVPHTYARSFFVIQDRASRGGSTMDTIGLRPRKAIPDSFSGEPALLNHKYVAAFAEAKRILDADGNDKAMVILYNGNERASLVDIGVPNFLGLVAPLRTPATKELPEWAREWKRSVPPGGLLPMEAVTA